MVILSPCTDAIIQIYYVESGKCDRAPNQGEPQAISWDWCPFVLDPCGWELRMYLRIHLARAVPMGVVEGAVE